jgi:hypothetical protein
MAGQETIISATITLEDAQRAAAAINQYMADWRDPESPFRDARVSALGAFYGVNPLSGKRRTLWLVQSWQPREGVRTYQLFPLVFIGEEESEEVYLCMGDRQFEDLYPYPKQSAALPAQVSSGASTQQEGGVA